MFNQKKDLLEKAATLKRFEYSLIRKELKSQTDIEQKQYQRLDNTYEFDKLIKKEQPTLGKCSKSNVIYNSNYNFYKYYCDSKKIDNLSLNSKHLFLVNFLDGLNK